MKTNVFIMLTGILLIVLLFGSCQPQVSCEATNEEKKVITSEIEALVRDLWNPEKTSYETNDILRSRVDGFVYASDGKIISTSYNEFDQKMKEGFAGVQKFVEAEIPAIHVFVLSKEAATCTYLFKSKFIATSGDTAVNNGCWTFVFKKFENGWKVVQENDTHTIN